VIVGRSGAKFVPLVLFYKSVSLVNMCRKMKRKRSRGKGNKEQIVCTCVRFGVLDAVYFKLAIFCSIMQFSR